LSHYNSLKTKIKNRDSLVKALCKMGFSQDQIEVHDEATNLYGYQGDMRKQKADVIIRKKYVGQASNDLGFKKTKTGEYEAIISNYDRKRYNNKWQGKLEMHYGIEQSKKAFTANGWTYKETTNSQGKLQLIGQRW